MQKRSENTYQKINTIFKRDIHNCIMPYDGFVSEELEWLRGCLFDGEEKIDGTNIRIEVSSSVVFGPFINEKGETVDGITDTAGIEWHVDYKGKTDRATIPDKLHKFLSDTYTEEVVFNALGIKKTMMLSNEEDRAMFEEKKWLDEEGGIDLSKVPGMYTIYGEGYGAGIQKGGGKYRKDNAFIGFDVKVNNVYLLRENRDDILTKLGCPIVPYMGQFTIDEAINFVKAGFNSKIAEEERLAEGLVLRSPMGLRDRRGERIIFKVKYEDFQKYRDTYGTDGPVEQIPHKV